MDETRTMTLAEIWHSMYDGQIPDAAVRTERGTLIVRLQEGLWALRVADGWLYLGQPEMGAHGLVGWLSNALDLYDCMTDTPLPDGFYEFGGEAITDFNIEGGREAGHWLSRMDSFENAVVDTYGWPSWPVQ